MPVSWGLEARGRFAQLLACSLTQWGLVETHCVLVQPRPYRGTPLPV